MLHSQIAVNLGFYPHRTSHLKVFIFVFYCSAEVQTFLKNIFTYSIEYTKMKYILLRNEECWIVFRRSTQTWSNLEDTDK